MKLFNTLTRQIDDLKPLQDSTVSFYTCGLTVYSQPHIGNWVGYIYWDILERTLESENYRVNRVQNITDVGHLVSDGDDGEDKMEKGARSEGLSAWDVAEKYMTIADHEGYDLLKLRRPKLIRATDYIEQQIAFVKKLEKKGYTYQIDGDGIYFDTCKLKDYGKLAQLDITGLQAGSRVAFKDKRNVTDFALWKFSPQNTKRDMEWESPWGVGFPGWHLECSVIALEGLGEQIDIHAGGVDHIPIHHTNEIAQTESLTGKQFASIWIHNNHLKVDGRKMSKSLGNIYTLQNIIDKGYQLEAFKILVLSKHYQTEGNFTWDILAAAQNRLQNWRASADLIWQIEQDETQYNDVVATIKQALSDNLNTPQALMLIDQYFNAVTHVQKAPNQQFLEFIDEALGIYIIRDDILDKQKSLIKQREAARKDANWILSDEVRDELQKQGILLNDSGGRTLWYRG